MDEVELIAQARRGTDSAWVELVRLHQQAVFRLAYLLLGDAAEAEDAAQDCFIRAYRGLHRFDASRPMRPWLLRIVANVASNRRRSLGRYWSALQKAARQQEPFIEERTKEVEQDAKDLWKAVKQLPVPMQKIIYLRYFLECSVDEAATALQLPTGTIKSQTHRALARLQTVIHRDFPKLEESHAG